VNAQELGLEAATKHAADKAARRELEIVSRLKSPIGLVDALFAHSRYVSVCMSFSPALAHKYCSLRALQIARSPWPWPADPAAFIADGVELLIQLSKEDSQCDANF
jgi:hypothetical protein